MLDRPGFDFSFSGLKTAVLLAVRRRSEVPDGNSAADVAAGFQAAVVDTLAGRTVQALEATGLERLVVAGGVGANRALRERLAAEVAKRGAAVYYPRPLFCTDNGAMIALTGALRAADAVHRPDRILARARWPLEELRPPGAAWQEAS
jgi:N6-L-threonylcarbamoyladenine synthase